MIADSLKTLKSSKLLTLLLAGLQINSLSKPSESQKQNNAYKTMNQ